MFYCMFLRALEPANQLFVRDKTTKKVSRNGQDLYRNTIRTLVIK